MKTSEKSKYKKIGSRIREVREMSGMSQKDLAEKIDFESATAISLIETGSRKVSIENLMKMAKLFDVKVSFFLDEDSSQGTDTLGALRNDRKLTDEDRETLTNIYQRFANKG